MSVMLRGVAADLKKRGNVMLNLLAKILKRSLLAVVIFTFTIFLIGCSSGFKTIAPTLPEKYEKLGQAKGEGLGVLCLVSPTYNFIPIGLNSRVDEAYDRAVKSIPGATALTDVTYQETWYWLVIGTFRTVTITGEAIKEVKQ